MAATDGLIDLMNTPAGRSVEVPAGNGVGNARALARMYAACLGDVDGVRLLRPETVAAMTRQQTDHIGPPPPFPRADPMSVQRFGLGFELERTPIPLLGPRCFGHPGAGGRLGFADPASGHSVGYACNGMLWDGRTPDPRWAWLAPLRAVA
jgi:CubicO group peptidase (beta-lactamase class C family)